SIRGHAIMAEPQQNRRVKNGTPSRVERHISPVAHVRRARLLHGYPAHAQIRALQKVLHKVRRPDGRISHFVEINDTPLRTRESLGTARKDGLLSPTLSSRGREGDGPECPL